MSNANITYTTAITLLTANTVANTDNVVVSVSFNYIATSDDGRIERMPMILAFNEEPDSNTFVPLANLTLDIVNGWIANGWTEKANTEARLAALFIKVPVTLPWVTVDDTDDEDDANTIVYTANNPVPNVANTTPSLVVTRANT